ncbi:MAG: 1-deoxy-D-xylulose-5-phosphate reductoisomerase [Clostridia bacterium]|nr:1-deoxy-D-xylulose-5-phosphate reductoisomerase [Clostridia bacterium]MBR5015461.1 1-deoxy-D-xylulose-5-phosphate reductoisomerase [Clostridia bacterium]MBR5991471.1 1-deoxy-D-xylulose-5-phosphate reductoisomerase [Clostridia bacterium]
MTDKLIILGSTGSIGTQALDVARKRGIKITALTASSNAELLEKQAREFEPVKVALLDEQAAADLRVRLADTDVKVLSGIGGICECAREESADTVLNSIVGMAGLVPTLDAIDEGKNLALANKETLVAGGQLVMNAARKKGVNIYPVDSEHSAIFQCLKCAPQNRALKRILLTASGGPFFGMTREELRDVTAEQALKHPNWDMGAKITIDSATMMNKGLEIIEACWLFGVSPEKIKVVVHRESIIHSAVEFDDNAVIAQLGLPDMKIPIQYALTYPDRFESPTEELDLAALGTLTFAEPDYETFDCLAVCREAIHRGGLYPAAANSANEQANSLFRKGRIGFLDIGELVGEAMEACENVEDYTLMDVMTTDRLAREFVSRKVGSL